MPDEIKQENGSAEDVAKKYEEAMAEVERLREHNKKVLGEKKQKQDEFAELKNRIDEIEAERKVLEDEKAEKEAREAGNFEELLKQREQRVAEKYEDNVTVLQAQLERYKTSFIQDRKQNELNKAIDAVNVSPHFKKAVSLMIGSSVQVEETDAGIDVYVVSDGQRMTVSQYVDLWAGGEEGKHYIAAPANSGGGQHGSGNGNLTNGKNNPFTTEGWNMTEQAKLKKTNLSEYNRMKAAAGK